MSSRSHSVTSVLSRGLYADANLRVRLPDRRHSLRSHADVAVNNPAGTDSNADACVNSSTSSNANTQYRHGDWQCDRRDLPRHLAEHRRPNHQWRQRREVSDD